MAGNREEVTGWIALLVASARAPGGLRCVGDAAPDVAPLARDVESIGPVGRWLATQMSATAGLNLLQGSYASHRRANNARPLWRVAAMLAVAALLLAFAHAALDRYQLQQHNVAQRVEMEQLLRSAMPDITRVVDPRAQLGAAFARLQGGAASSDALPLLARIAPSIAGSGRYTIDGLEFRSGILDLVVRADGIAALDQLRETLAALPDLQVELTSANPGVGGYEGRLRIRERGA
jgi:general secretion pathway protein L